MGIKYWVSAMNWDWLSAWTAPSSWLLSRAVHSHSTQEQGISPYTRRTFQWCDRINCRGHWGASQLARENWENRVLWIQRCQRKRWSQTQNVLVPRTFQLWAVLQWSWNQRKKQLLNSVIFMLSPTDPSLQSYPGRSFCFIGIGVCFFNY